MFVPVHQPSSSMSHDHEELGRIRERRGSPQMPAYPQVEALMGFLNVEVKALATCVVGEGHALKVGPIDEIVVHYAIEGDGAIEWVGGRLPLSKGMVAIIPRNFPKRLTGRGKVLKEIPLDEGCVLGNGIVKYQTSHEDQLPLRLACATICAGMSPGLGLFDHLIEPLTEPSDTTLSHMFEEILNEFADPAIWGKAIVENYMKQILMVTFRRVIHRGDVRSPLYATIMDYKIARSVSAIIKDPSQRHSLESLAEIAGMGPACFALKFESIFRQSPTQFLHGVRMEAAKRLLKATRLPVKAIAGSVGFSSRSHFSRAFSRAYDQDPTSFRTMSSV